MKQDNSKSLIITCQIPKSLSNSLRYQMLYICLLIRTLLYLFLSILWTLNAFPTRYEIISSQKYSIHSLTQMRGNWTTIDVLVVVAGPSQSCSADFRSSSPHYLSSILHIIWTDGLQLHEDESTTGAGHFSFRQILSTG